MFQYEPDARDDMDSYGEICYEVGLDLEPNKYAKLRKAAMLAQEEQNDPLPCALLCIDQLFLKFRDMFRTSKHFCSGSRAIFVLPESSILIYCVLSTRVRVSGRCGGRLPTAQ